MNVSMPKIFKCDFEVFGLVQGVCFRMFTEKQANALGVRGWCMNTKNDTVQGQLEGEMQPFSDMKIWLQRTGSPGSRITKAVFSEPPIELDNYSFENFNIRR